MVTVTTAGEVETTHSLFPFGTTDFAHVLAELAPTLQELILSNPIPSERPMLNFIDEEHGRSLNQALSLSTRLRKVHLPWSLLSADWLGALSANRALASITLGCRPDNTATPADFSGSLTMLCPMGAKMCELTSGVLAGHTHVYYSQSTP